MDLRSLATRAIASVRSLVTTTPGPGAVAVPVEREALTTATVAQVRAWLDDHDRGRFADSAALASLVTRDADLFGALNQRLLSLLGCEVEFEPANSSAKAKAWADDLKALWPRMAPMAAQADLMASAVMLGFGDAQLVWQWDDERDELVPTLDPWSSAAVEYRTFERRWQAQTLTGQVDITPGDGQWVHYAPRSVYGPHLWGALRCTALWYLRNDYTGSDASRHSELHGIPVWLADLPSGARETADGKAFVRSIRTMGRNAVVPCPQGSDKASSYDLRLVQAATDTFKIFEYLTRSGAGKMRLAILGQDLTSQNNQIGTHASSETGMTVTGLVIASDAQTWDATAYEQIVLPWARYRGRPDLAPRPRTKAKPAENLATLAGGLQSFGAALTSLRSGLAPVGLELDPASVRSLATRFGLQVRTIPEPEPAPTPAPAPAAPPSSPQDPTP